jgi:hypothetical protein
MQRWTAVFFLVLFAGSAALVVAKGGPRPAPTPVAKADAGAADAGGDAAAHAEVDASADPLDAGEPPAEGESAEGIRVDAGGALLLNGQPAPPVAAEAPKSVVFGAILVTYRGAQGAPANARTREAALELAQNLFADAKTDFKATVAKGDKGSTENLGRMPRGVLEPAPEYVLFSLGKGEVGGPIDTPRGYWIVQRIE